MEENLEDDPPIMDIPGTALSCFFVVSTMLAIGLRVTGREILSSISDKRLIGRVLVANVVLVPLLGIILAKIFRLDTAGQVGIILLGCAPGGINAIQFSGKIKSHVAFATGLLVLLNILAVTLTPLMSNAILPVEIKVTLPYLRFAGLLTVLLLLPLLAGFYINKRWPRFSELIYTPLIAFSNIAFVAVVLLTMDLKKEAIALVNWNLTAALLFLIIGSMIIGWLLGGPDRGMRRVMAISTNMRNMALCIMLSIMGFPERDVDVPILVYMMLIVPPNMLFTVYHAIKDKREHPPAGKAAAAADPGL